MILSNLVEIKPKDGKIYKIDFSKFTDESIKRLQELRKQVIELPMEINVSTVQPQQAPVNYLVYEILEIITGIDRKEYSRFKGISCETGREIFLAIKEESDKRAKELKANSSR